jgi:TolB protein
VIDDIEIVPSFSPDGKKIAFLRIVKDEEWIMTAQADGNDQRKIRAHKSPPAYYEDVEWSPDGKMIALFKNIETSNTHSKQIVGINLIDSSERILFDMRWPADIYYDDLKWFTDGSGLIFTKSANGKRQIYHITYPNGELSSITNDLNEYRQLSLTSDNKYLLATQRIVNQTIWAASSTRPDDMIQLTSGSIVEDGSRGISWTTDGKIIYESIEPTGEVQLWLINPDGTDRKRITTGKAVKRFPECSPDGRYIVYTEEGEFSKIVRINSDGSNLKVISGTKLSRWPRVSPDSSWVVFSTFGGEQQELIKVQMDGANETVLTSHHTMYGAAISPDGNQIAYVYIDPEKSSSMLMNIISSNGGPVLKSFELDQNTFPIGRIRWTPDGRGLAYIRMEEDGWDIYVQPVDGSLSRRLTNLTADIIVNFAWSFDGKSMAYSRGKRTSDLVLIENVP